MTGSSSPNSGVPVSSVDIDSHLLSCLWNWNSARVSCSHGASVFTFAEFALPLLPRSRIRFVGEREAGDSIAWPW